MKTRSRKKQPITFNGVRYYEIHHGYFQCASIPAINQRAETLHRAIWKDTNGPIPDGFNIHHIDGNTSNNDIENFKLISSEAHMREKGHILYPRSHQGVCPQCGGGFIRIFHGVKPTYCSDVCQRRSSYLRKKKDNKDGCCEYCSEPCYTNGGKVRFCSKSCAAKGRHRLSKTK